MKEGDLSIGNNSSGLFWRTYNSKRQQRDGHLFISTPGERRNLYQLHGKDEDESGRWEGGRPRK